MKKVLIRLLLLSSAFQFDFPCHSQISYPDGLGYFELGWSADGKRFAYADFFKKHYSDNVPSPEYDYTVLNITVIDLVSDQELWKHNSQWKDDNPVYPTTIYSALEYQPEDVYSLLRDHGITSVYHVPLKQFPIENGMYLHWR